MSVTVRPALVSDLAVMADLLIQDAEQRHAVDQVLWKLKPNAREAVPSAIKAAMENDNPPFRQQWLLAESGGEIVGITHSILLPVPPIYAGEFGPPGLIMEDCFVTENAPAETPEILLKAAEADLVQAGAKILLTSSIVGGAWQAEYTAQDYEPLTLYFAKSGLDDATHLDGVRPATEGDVSAIVKASALNRQILFDLERFWKPNPEADARFGSWMKRSLTLPDRDMFVSEAEGIVEGYAISQPSTALHFPAPHDISGIGFIDDYFHADYDDPAKLDAGGNAASSLLIAAESALKARGNKAALIVSPAAWTSKIAVLENAGYQTAVTWSIKRV